VCIFEEIYWYLFVRIKESRALKIQLVEVFSCFLVVKKII